MKTILVILDDRQQQDILAAKLKSETTRIISAFNGGDGWALVQKENPDLIILEIMLPGGMNGFDFLEMLKRNEQFKKIPVIVLTNLDTEEKTSKMIGVADYLIKSNTSLDELVSRIKSIIA